MSIHQKIQTFCNAAVGEHHRYRSWEHCYGYFRSNRAISLDRDQAALQLGFYLASWGMYRGSSFLLQHAYTVHRGVIDLIAEGRFTELWDADVGASEADVKFVPVIIELIKGVREAYKPFAPAIASAQPTETLITKVLLGTFGCLPACDRYFIDGFKREGLKYSDVNDRFTKRVLDFCLANLGELRAEQADIEKRRGTHYPLMKLVDMYFWEIGYEQAAKKN